MQKPAATLLVSPTCPHCRDMKTVLKQLRDEKILGRLDIVDITGRPDLARSLGVRSVPWLQLGEMVFEGAHTSGELTKWASTASRDDALTEYFRSILNQGQLALAQRMIAGKPERIAALLPLVGDADTEMSVRIGIAAIFEARRGTPELGTISDKLADLCRHPSPTVRADACHLLVQAASPAHAETLRRMLTDNDPQVRDIASDGLDELKKEYPVMHDG
jgi:thioredoxin-like negative regulator of GroEL